VSACIETVLVTGGSGFIDRNFVRYPLETGPHGCL
jgi:dTDP-D-glucose 4,6-dehydratase